MMTERPDAHTPIFDELMEEWPAVWAEHEVNKALKAKEVRENGGEDTAGADSDGAPVEGS